VSVDTWVADTVVDHIVAVGSTVVAVVEVRLRWVVAYDIPFLCTTTRKMWIT